MSLQELLVQWEKASSKQRKISDTSAVKEIKRCCDPE